MKTKAIVILSLIGLLFIGAVIWSMSVTYTNAEIDQRKGVIAQSKKVEACFDLMWKVIQQQAGVSDEYKNGFKDIYTGLIEGRYSKGDGSLMKWITESNPTFDVSLYKTLMQSIEIERTGFFNEQTRLIDMQREHAVLLEKQPSSWFISDDKKPVEIVIVTSEKTSQAFQTGKEDDINLFKEN